MKHKWNMTMNTFSGEFPHRDNLLTFFSRGSFFSPYFQFFIAYLVSLQSKDKASI